jgi:hypothetical protein
VGVEVAGNFALEFPHERVSPLDRIVRSRKVALSRVAARG